jgi:hypothetical protein
MGGQFDIILIKQLETRELDRFPMNETPVGVEFLRRFSPTIHIHDDLHFGTGDDVFVIRDHALGEAMDYQYLWG